MVRFAERVCPAGAFHVTNIALRARTAIGVAADLCAPKYRARCLCCAAITQSARPQATFPGTAARFDDLSVSDAIFRRLPAV